MENNFDPFKFDEPTVVKNYSFMIRVISLMLILLFIVFPLSELCPSGFVKEGTSFHDFTIYTINFFKNY